MENAEENQAIDLVQPENQAIDLEQPENQAIDLEQPGNLAIDLAQPENQPIDLEQPENQAIGHVQPENQAIDLEQPENQASDLAQAENQAIVQQLEIQPEEPEAQANVDLVEEVVAGENNAANEVPLPEEQPAPEMVVIHPAAPMEEFEMAENQAEEQAHLEIVGVGIPNPAGQAVAALEPMPMPPGFPPRQNPGLPRPAGIIRQIPQQRLHPFIRLLDLNDPRIGGRRTRQVYSRQHRDAAMDLLRQGLSYRQVARYISPTCSPSTIHTWRRSEIRTRRLMGRFDRYVVRRGGRR